MLINYSGHYRTVNRPGHTPNVTVIYMLSYIHVIYDIHSYIYMSYICLTLVIKPRVEPRNFILVAVGVLAH